jgi:hypothetical protein
MTKPGAPFCPDERQNTKDKAFNDAVRVPESQGQTALAWGELEGKAAQF